jgi:hypothetical protein
MFPQREFLIERLNAARQALDALLPDAPTDKYIYPTWTIKEFLDHLSAWDAAVVEALHAHAKGEPVPQTAARGINSYNAHAITERKKIDLEASKREFHSSRMAVIQALKDLPDAKFNEPLLFPWGEYGTVAYFIEIFVDHDEHHTKHLAGWLKNPREVIREH